jgi:hypothetical protein
MDPTSKLLVVVDVGSRTLAMAQRVVHQVTEVLAPGCAPLLLTDGLKDYATALLTHFGQWMQPERRQDKGPIPKPRWMPLPALRYAQVVKSYRRLVGVTHRVVFGTRLAIEQVLAACGWTINTAFIERLNLDIRQRVAAVGRRVNTLCRGAEGLLDQMVLVQTYHNLVLPHASLRPPLPVAEATNGGSAKVWRPCTPAMAAGLTDHMWSLKEVLPAAGHPSDGSSGDRWNYPQRPGTRPAPGAGPLLPAAGCATPLGDAHPAGHCGGFRAIRDGSCPSLRRHTISLTGYDRVAMITTEPGRNYAAYPGSSVERAMPSRPGSDVRQSGRE